ncbi:CrcB family protein [Arsenicicoccus sp. MKL-02]|uniref:Fluoride-specific ion channel FluC n=1 Tax=Arsenicicoccus cauae TaxID=2663847 RepID=A0A6I3IYZ3_9MICO|nr:CrcB family protein [Arsenicicoccus cauae]
MHLQGRYVALVAAGGGAGAATREALVLAVPAEGFDTVVLMINLVGAFALGLLLERLLLAGPDRGRRRAARLLLGTGVLGGFTTYSTLALDTVHLLQRGEVGMAIAYGLTTVLLGAVASVAGIRCGAALGRRRPA